VDNSQAGTGNKPSLLIVNILYWLIWLSAAAVAIASVYLGYFITPYFLLMNVALVPLMTLVYSFSKKRRDLRLLVQLRRDWGAVRVTKDRDLEAIRQLFDYGVSVRQSVTRIDDETWDDLEMEGLFEKIDRTLTDPGEAVLYRMLREPLFQRDSIEERNRIVRVFEKDARLREKIQIVFARRGRQLVHNDLFTLLWRDRYPESRWRLFFNGLALAALVSLVVPLAFWSGILVLVPIGMFIINLITHYYARRRKDMEITSFPYLIECLYAARELSSVEDSEVSAYTRRIGELYRKCRNILSRSRFQSRLYSQSADPYISPALEYINIFFLVEVRAFFDTTAELIRHARDLRELYTALGELDALLSIASYRAGLPSYTIPEFTAVGTSLDIKEARQPLLDNPVPSSVAVTRNVAVITGSNMAGKSTFLRNIGINVLLAQTIAATLTSSYRAPLMRVITSISRSDDLKAGKSFYYMEAERILRAIQSLDDKITILCIIDELLSGTNSIERLQASEAIIRYLAAQNAVTIVATHDLELAQRLTGSCDFYHFTDNVSERGLSFDYQIKPGIATTRNAIALLKYLGYPPEITRDADK
jgi:DNA mismatch repair ATPase MutS